MWERWEARGEGEWALGGADACSDGGEGVVHVVDVEDVHASRNIATTDDNSGGRRVRRRRWRRECAGGGGVGVGWWWCV